MANRSILGVATLLTAFMAMTMDAVAQADPLETSNRTSIDAVQPSGIRTDRLSPKQLRTWQSIRNIVSAEDRSGRPLHPRLYELWRSAQQSGHLIFIELVTGGQWTAYSAGEFVVEKLDPEGRQHILALRLFLSTIDRASTNFAAAGRPDGFIPFQGLHGKARYAEVLGHELAHIVAMFNDSEYLRLQIEAHKVRDAFLLARHSMSKEAVDQKESMIRLTREAEKPAEAAEAEIWRELQASQRFRPAS
jgi:hypothetical protein